MLSRSEISRVSRRIALSALGLVALGLRAYGQGEPPAFEWQKSYARMLPHGDLEWDSEPMYFEEGETVRYIDFEGGSDANSGESPEEAWKRHPWDAAATGRSLAARDTGVDTYIFKGGAIYRGELNPGEEGGSPGSPIRLTRDPSWGKGLPLIYGSERVTEWSRGAHPKMPQPDRVWVAEVDFLPRTLWMRDPVSGRITRLHLARDPNWTVSDRNEILSEWPTWDQPEWWTGKNVVEVDGQERHLGIDADRLKGLETEDVVGATVWTEWGIVMGSPYPARVEAYDPEKGGVAFRGPWTFDMSERIITGNRYYLEDKPQWLDSDGEFWVEKMEGGGGRIYVRLPEGEDPNAVTIEAGKRTRFLKADKLYHVEISGLHFRFTNIHWEYDIPQWAHPDLRDAVIRLAGGGDGIDIHHNVFQHVVMPIRIVASSDDHPYVGSPIGSVRVADNVMQYTDHEAIVIGGHAGGRETNDGPLARVEVLRNKLDEIGKRNRSGAHGHAIDIRFPETSLVAGNFLHRIAGWGIAVFGGKASGNRFEAPLSRQIIMQNRVEDALLKSNDWGGIETWQGGTHYVFNNLVVNPRGFKNWIYEQKKKERIPAFGHAYYLDGSFKNYLFNNIAWGMNNEPGGKYANNTALQNIISFENTFFHNTFFRFGEVVRQQAPSAGRFRYLSNVIEDASLLLFRLADPKGVAPDPNAAHYTQGGVFAYETLAFKDNVLSDIRGPFGVFEETGAVYPTLEQMTESLRRTDAMAAGIGVEVEQPVLRNPEGGDFRPRELEAVRGRASKVFVPWALKRAVGEWTFRLNREDPTRVIDEHWNMTSDYVDRQNYKDTPRFPLRGIGIGADDFEPGSLDDWVPSALRLDGRRQRLELSQAEIEKGAAGNTVDVGEGSFLVEVAFRTSDQAGVLVRKRAGAGYSLDVVEGRIRFSVMDAEERQLAVQTENAIADGQLRHVVAEFDRAAGLRLHVDGRLAAFQSEGFEDLGSLANEGDFEVGGAEEGEGLACQLEFLRVAQSTLEESRTSIEELFAWQFDGPQMRDFAGRKRHFAGGAAGAIELE